MKKLISLLLLTATLLSAASLAACADRSDDPEGTTTTTASNGAQNSAPSQDDYKTLDLTLAEVVESIKSPDTQYPTIEEVPLADDETFRYHFGISTPDGMKESLLMMPGITSIAFTLGLIRVEKGTDAEKLARDIESALDTKHWLCAPPSFVKTAVNGDVILLVVDGDDARGKALLDAFKAL